MPAEGATESLTRAINIAVNSDENPEVKVVGVAIQ